VYFSLDGVAWQDAVVPAGAAPARAIVALAGRRYLAGEHGVFASNDRGQTWIAATEGLPDAPVDALVAVAGVDNALLAVCAGRVWASPDEGASWRPNDTGLPAGRVETMAYDGKLWATAADRVFVFEAGQGLWLPVGNPLPESETSVRAIAVADSGRILLLTTHRGVLRSDDGGVNWLLRWILARALSGNVAAGANWRQPSCAPGSGQPCRWGGISGLAGGGCRIRGALADGPWLTKAGMNWRKEA
jgi:photosystem II stability/assembly factor-like uncharacterized protein